MGGGGSHNTIAIYCSLTLVTTLMAMMAIYCKDVLNTDLLTLSTDFTKYRFMLNTHLKMFKYRFMLNTDMLSTDLLMLNTDLLSTDLC